MQRNEKYNVQTNFSKAVLEKTFLKLNEMLNQTSLNELNFKILKEKMLLLSEISARFIFCYDSLQK